MNPRDLEQTVQDAFDGLLDEQGAEALRQQLRDSPAALALYCDQAVLESELHRHASSRCKIPGAIPAAVGLAAAIRQRRNVRISILAAAAVLLFTGVLLQLIVIAPNRSLASVETSAGSTLVLEDGTPFRETGLKRDQTVSLGQGVAKLVFECGAEAVIEGPATLKLLAADRLELSAGHSWFRVPEKARGFRVLTPQVEVTDLGTEFGIDLREDLPPQVHVLQGAVEALARVGKREQLTMRAGQAATLAPTGSWTLAAADFHKFRDRLPAAIPVLKMDFDSLDGDVLALGGDALGVSGATARLIRPERAALVPGIRGKALEFLGDGAFVETTWPGISGSAPRTVSVWCRLPAQARPQTAPPLAWWGNPAQGWNRKFKIALVTDARGQTVLRASFGEAIFDGATDLADGAWHHLAVVYRGNLPGGIPDISFHVDGQSEPITHPAAAQTAIETDIRSDTAGCLALGKYELPATGRNPFLRGALDELRIFAGALDESAIRELAARP